MAKMNKSAAVEAAKNLARRHVEANAMTVEQVNALGDYNARRTAAARLYLPINLDTDYRRDAQGAFEDAVLNIWGSKLKALENARKRFQSAAKSMTLEQAHAKITELVKSFRLRGLRDSSDLTSVTVERACGVSASVYFRYEREDGLGIVNPDDETQRVNSYALRIEFSWSSTGRTMAEALASANLYRELIDMAAEVEAVMGREKVVSTWGIPEVIVAEPVEAAVL